MPFVANAASKAYLMKMFHDTDIFMHTRIQYTGSNSRVELVTLDATTILRGEYIVLETSRLRALGDTPILAMNGATFTGKDIRHWIEQEYEAQSLIAVSIGPPLTDSVRITGIVLARLRQRKRLVRTTKMMWYGKRRRK